MGKQCEVCAVDISNYRNMPPGKVVQCWVCYTRKVFSKEG